MHHLNHKGDVMNAHAPSEMILDQLQVNDPIQVPLADILASWIWRPYASPRRGDLVKEAEFAVEEEFRETWSWGRGSVVVSEAEGV